MRKSFANIVPVLTILLAIFGTYKSVADTFFQQDEWQYFGSTIYSLQSSHPIANILLPLQGQVTHFFPLATLMFLLEYIFFKTNFPPYILLNIFIHMANALLLYVLVFLLTRKRVLAWGAALFFSVNSLANQPVTWVAAGIGTLPGTFFLLLFFICLMRFIQTKRHFMLVWGFISLFTSILFKEISIFVFLFLSLMWFVGKILFRRSLKVPRAALLAFVALGVFYVALRVLFLLAPIRSAQPEVGDVSIASVGTYAYRLIAVPLKAFPQSIIPFSMLAAVSRGVIHLAYPQFVASDGIANPYIAESIVFDLVSFFGSTLLLLASFHMYRFLRKQEPQLAKVLTVSVLFIGMSALPYMFIPGKAGFFSIFEPRNLYMIGIGSSIWIVLLFYCLGTWLQPSQKSLYIMTLLIGLFAILHSFFIQQDITKLVSIGTIRKHFLTTIEDTYTKLPEKIIFYTESDRSYYGLSVDEKILPVQSGLGRMLMVWYQDKEQFPGCLYEDQFLHDLTSQGYRFCGGRGFGYARQYDKLLQLLKEHTLISTNVVGYSWTGRTAEFRDITLDLRKRIDHDLVRF